MVSLIRAAVRCRTGWPQSKPGFGLSPPVAYQTTRPGQMVTETGWVVPSVHRRQRRAPAEASTYRSRAGREALPAVGRALGSLLIAAVFMAAACQPRPEGGSA